jgi:hypothetical protein
MDGPWSRAAVDRYVTGGYDGLLYRPARGTTHRSLEFLLELPGLRSLTVYARVVDDSAVNDIESLEQLTLLTRSKVPLAVEWLSRLHNLAVDARPDLNAIRGLHQLQALYLAWWCAASDSSPPAQSAPCTQSPHCRGLATSGSTKSPSMTAT